MSSKFTHFVAGTALGSIVASAHFGNFHEAISAGMLFVGAVAGSSAPDWFEISRWKRGRRRIFRQNDPDVRLSLVGHRTITHWLLLWVFTSLYYAMLILVEPLSPKTTFLFGFCISGLLHVYMDSRTPMGIPIYHPWRRTLGKQYRRRKQRNHQN